MSDWESSQWGTLGELARANRQYFSTHLDEYGLRITAAHIAILDTIDELRPLYDEISHIAPQFDFDENTPGNGYRSFLILVDKCILHSVDICQHIYLYRDSMLFRKSHYMREVETCSQLAASLCTFLHHLKTLYSWSDLASDGKMSLFPSDDHSPVELLNKAENIDQYCFYGRCMALQFADSIQYLLKPIMISMASFSEIYYRNSSLLNRCTNSLKYVVDPELRARRIVNLSQRADVHFCKAFWNLNESYLLQFVPFLMMPSLSINQIISIPPEELIILTIDGTDINIPVPNSHIGKKPIHVKLLSAKRRIGMVGAATVNGELLGPSDTLLFHCHGGGFVAQSSRSHEVYLRQWAHKLDVPILSVDYSLSPEAPFPRAIEEVLYTYCWVLKHASSLLGSTVKKIILIGDSAGANLNLGLLTQCIKLNIQKPHGVFMAYVPVLVEFVPSPARMLGLTDPMLPFGFMMRCLKAYTLGDDKLNTKEKDMEIISMKSNTESFAEVSESDLIALALSPNDDEINESKLASLPSDSTLNSVSLAEVDGQGAIIQSTEEIKNESTSQKYFKKIINLYKSATFQNSSSTSAISPNHYDKTNDDKSSSFFGLTFGGDNQISRELDMCYTKSPTEAFVFTVPRDPLLSPYRIDDEILEKFPPVKFLTTNFDPCLDDCVMFARKLKSLGNNLSLDIVPGLPHGFLNLCAMSKDSFEGSELCSKRIHELMNM
ncbi:hypothetical protein PV328_009204 [Microctonus aethiopoides]|uniref:Hormone-sensitive lipase n=1 Tax=Microctonus aethiopoides TaxID=144406 RepID=A0AA39C5D2_9HYME|nr:hypothetical protein PV328_009204 [Microctonus aethiopoides]